MNNDTNQEEYTIYCSRCGSEMKNTQRYCMKCGNLNYDHADNESMKAYASDEATTYEVGSGKIVNHSQNNQVMVSSEKNTGNKTFCFLLNLLLYFVSVVVSFFLTVSLSSITLESFLASKFPYFLIGFSLLFMYLYSVQLIFIKANQKWWAAFVPFYNLFIMGEIVFHKKALGLIFMIPVVGTVIFFYLLGKKFNYQGLLVALFFFIYIPIIAFGSHYYEKKMFVDSNVDNKAIERDYSQRKAYITIILIGIMLGTGVVIYTNLTGIKNTGTAIGNYYYVFASRQLVSKTEQKINDHLITNCSKSSYQDDQGVYYIYLSDLGEKVYLPLYITRDPIEAYIKIDNTGEETKFYISMTDMSKGFKETLFEDINSNTVVDYTKINFSTNKDQKNICKFGS